MRTDIIEEERIFKEFYYLFYLVKFNFVIKIFCTLNEFELK
mgnify:CR=1 FL=1